MGKAAPRDYVLQVRVTSEQRAVLQAAADAHALDVSSWVRSVAVMKANGMDATPALSAAMAELARLPPGVSERHIAQHAAQSVTAACARCGFDPNATVKSEHTFLVKRETPSMNARLVNSGPSRFAYGKERGVWVMEFRAARLNNKIPKAAPNGRRRVTLTRVYGGKARGRDRDNLIGGMKAVVDAMVLEGLLADDTEARAELHYGQRKAGKALIPGEQWTPEATGLWVVIEDLA